MEKTIFNITEYFENQDIDFQGITSFKVQNNGESLVDINTIPVCPGETTTIVEEDGTFCDFNLKSVFTEEGKLPKFKAIYKQLESEAASTDNLHNDYDYAVTLHDYQTGDIVEFSQNKSGNTVLMRSFDGGDTFDEANNIDLGYVESNQIFKYESGGSLETNAIKFEINIDEEIEESIDFIVGIIADVTLEMILYFGDIDATVSNLGIADKNSINDWNTFFNNRNSATFDSLKIIDNSIEFFKEDVSGIEDLILINMELIDFQINGLYGIGKLYLQNNQITQFDPSIALPNSLTLLSLSNNQITQFDPSIALPNSLTELILSNNQITQFDPSIALPNSLTLLRLSNNQITQFDPSIALPNSLTELILDYNQITQFDPSIALPNSLMNLYLNNNQITQFDPSIALPNSLRELNLGYNQITQFDPSIVLPNSLMYLYLFNNQITQFDPSIALPNSLRMLHLASNQLTQFDPSIALPNSLTELNLDINQINTTSWNQDTEWISLAPNNVRTFARNNTNTITGTTTQALLLAKGWTVYA